MQAWKKRWGGLGGGQEVLQLAVPLIVSNSFWTLQITIDRIFLSRHSSEAVGAAMTSVMFFWTAFGLFQTTALYASTFVAQYLGANRPERVGPVVWQSLYFSVLTGLAFLLLLPVVEPLIALGEHAPELQEMEATFLRCLCISTLPTLLVASATSFFLGRGASWIVMLVNAAGLIVNAVLDYLWIDGRWGFPQWGIAGAGWATVVGAWTSALLALVLLFRPCYREQFATVRGWRFDAALLRRLLYFGIPSGLPMFIECFAFAVVMSLIGRLGTADLAASSIAFTLNMLAVLPTLGIGQAVAVLVGRRLGENRPDLAERSTWSGLALAWMLMTAVGLVLVLFPQPFLILFHTQNDQDTWDVVAALVPILLRFVAVYCLFDSMNLVFSFALKGAGDTRFPTIAALVLAWPIMVLPTWAAWYYDWGLFWAWGFISAYVIVLAFTFLVRFRHGRWKLMRVIEQTPAGAETPTAEQAVAV